MRAATLHAVIPGRTDRCESGIQKHALCLHLDSGFALSARPGMTILRVTEWFLDR
jgi:hypothetical protein